MAATDRTTAETAATPWSTAAHLAGLVPLVGIPGFAGPLTVWLLRRGEEPVDRAGREATAFHLSLLVYGLVLGLVVAVLVLAPGSPRVWGPALAPIAVLGGVGFGLLAFSLGVFGVAAAPVVLLMGGLGVRTPPAALVLFGLAVLATWAAVVALVAINAARASRGGATRYPFSLPFLSSR